MLNAARTGANTTRSFGKALVRHPAQALNTVAKQVPQVAYTGQMLLANASKNPEAWGNANRRAQAANEMFDRNKGGLFNAGTFYGADEAKRGDLKTGVQTIGGGTLATAATVVPFARGASFALGKAPITKQAIARLGTEGTVYGGAYSTGQQMQDTGRVDAKQVALESLLGAGANIGLPVIGRGVKIGAQKGAKLTGQAVDNALHPKYAGLRKDQVIMDTSKLDALHNARQMLAGQSDNPGLRQTVSEGLDRINRENGLDFISGSPEQRLQRLTQYLEQNGEAIQKLQSKSGKKRLTPMGEDGYFQLPGRKMPDMYHGSNKKFDVFDPDKIQPGTFGKAAYITNDKKMAGYYGSEINEFVTPQNMKLHISEDMNTKAADFNRARELYKKATGKELRIDASGWGNDTNGTTRVFWRTTDNPEINKAKELWRQDLIKKGYAGVKEEDTVAIFNPSKLKKKLLKSLDEQGSVPNPFHKKYDSLKKKLNDPNISRTRKEAILEEMDGLAAKMDTRMDDATRISEQARLSNQLPSPSGKKGFVPFESKRAARKILGDLGEGGGRNAPRNQAEADAMFGPSGRFSKEQSSAQSAPENPYANRPLHEIAKELDVSDADRAVLQAVEDQIQKQGGLNGGYLATAERMGLRDKWQEASGNVSRAAMSAYQKANPNIGILTPTAGRAKKPLPAPEAPAGSQKITGSLPRSIADAKTPEEIAAVLGPNPSKAQITEAKARIAELRITPNHLTDQTVKVTAKGGKKQLPVSKVTRDGDTIIKTDVKNGTEKRFALDDNGDLIPDRKGAYRIFTDKDGHVTQFRIGNKIFKASELGDLGDVNGYGSIIATMRRNVERSFGKETGEKVNHFLVDHQQAQATKMIERRLQLKKGMQDVAHDLGISFGIGRGKAKKVSAAIQDFGEGRIDRAQLDEQFGPEMAEKIVRADAWFRNQYDSLLDEMNTTLTAYGYDPVPRRADYYTHFQDPSVWESFGLKMKEIRDWASPTMQDAVPEQGRGKISNKLAGESEFTLPNKAFNRFTLRREGDAHTADAFQAFERYLAPTLNNIYMTPSITRARVLARAIAQEADVRKVDANKTLIQIKEWANHLAGKSNRLGDRQLADTMLGPKVLKGMQFVQRRAGGNSIVGNLATAALQPVVLAQSAGRYGYKNFLLAALQEASTNHADDAAIRQSSFLKRRYADLTPVTATKTQRGAEVLNAPLHVVEQTSARIAWKTAHNEALAKGLKGKDAIQYADVQAEKTLAGRAIGERPEVFNAKMAGPLTMYQLEVNNFWQQTGKEMTKAQAAKTLAALYAFNLGLQQVTGRQVGFNPIDAAIDSYRETQKEDKSGKDKAIAIGQRFAGEVVDNAPFLGTLATTLAGEKNVSKLTGKDSNIGRFGGSSPLKTVIDNPWMLAVPYGGAQAKKTFQGAQAWAQGGLQNKEGETTVNVPKTLPNLGRALAFGKNAIPEVNLYNANIGRKKYDQKSVPNQTGSKAGTQSMQGLTKDQQETLKYQMSNFSQDQKDEFIRKSIEKNKADYQKEQDKKTGKKQLPSSTSSGSPVDQLLARKKGQNEQLKASLSDEDYKLMNMSKPDRKKLIDSGGVTQQKLDGLDWYVKNKKKELGIETTSRTTKNKGKYYTQNDAEYKDVKAKYQEDKKNGNLSRFGAVKAEKNLKKAEVGSKYSKDIRDLYTLPKAEVYHILSTDPNGKRMAEQLLAYGDALADAGLESNKFVDKYGNVSIKPKTSRTSTGGKSRRGRNTSTAKGRKAKLPKITSTRGTAISSLARLSKSSGNIRVKSPSTKTAKRPIKKITVGRA